ncbi:unnamed protein product [Haemonchus placei]|uniref:F-box domain-containing protein n=1 Tax=Haemonchus placei TaxID=6290 RepID=A0A158QN34_HAEPC|nr:unnamed protein product [Haemonchus placei]
MEDVWARVFTYLSPREVRKCERVSRTWRRLAHRALRQLVDVDFERDFQNAIADPDHLERILRLCSRRLKRVTFRVTSKNEKYSVFASEHHLTKSVVEALATTATALQSIVIDRMYCSTPEVNEIVQLALRQLLCQSPRLKRFEIVGRGWTFDHFVLDETVLLLLPPSLRDLSISAGGSLKITNLHFLRGKQLESLALQRSFISSADLVVLADMALSLTTLDLTSCINISDGTLLGQLHNLRRLVSEPFSIKGYQFARSRVCLCECHDGLAADSIAVDVVVVVVVRRRCDESIGE